MFEITFEIFVFTYIFSSWKGFWLTWDAVEMIDALEKIIPLVRNLNKPLADAMTVSINSN